MAWKIFLGIKQMLKVSAFYLEKQISFIPKKKLFSQSMPRLIQKMALAVLILSEGFVTTYNRFFLKLPQVKLWAVWLDLAEVIRAQLENILALIWLHFPHVLSLLEWKWLKPVVASTFQRKFCQYLDLHCWPCQNWACPNGVQHVLIVAETLFQRLKKMEIWI